MKIEYREGLLFTEIEITYKGKKKLVNNIVIDTGASKSLISQEAIEDLDLKYEKDDEIVVSYGIGGKEHAFVKTIDRIRLAGYEINNCKMDFCSQIYDDIYGLLGLDILLEGGFAINLRDLTISREE